MFNKDNLSIIGYMFDTNVFNQILDEEIECNLFSRINCFVTHIQHDEICNTKNPERKKRLEETFVLIEKRTILTETIILGTSRLNQAKLSDGILNKEILEMLNKKKKKLNNWEDALIAETAIMNSLTVVTHDEALFTIITNFDGSCCNLQHLFLLLSHAL